MNGKCFIFFASLAVVFFFSIASLQAEFGEKKQIDKSSYSLSHTSLVLSKCMQERNYKCAMDYIMKRTQEDPNGADNYFALGMLNYLLGNYIQSLSYYQRSIEIVPFLEADDDFDIGDPLIGLGVTYTALGNTEAAKTEFSKALDYFQKKRNYRMVLFIEAFLKQADK